MLPGAILLCAALWTMTTLDEVSPIWEVVIVQTVMMTSLAMMFTPLMTDSLGSLPGELYSHGSAILTTLQQVAGAAGTALFVTVMTLSSTSGGAPDVAGVQAAFTVAAVISVVVVLVAFMTGREPAKVEAPAH